MIAFLWALTLCRQCLSDLDSEDEFGIQAICQAKYEQFQNDQELELIMENCTTNVKEELLEGKSFPTSPLLLEEGPSSVDLVCRDEGLLIVEWQQSPQLVYVVEKSRHTQIQNEDWQPVNITNSGQIEISNLESNSTYRIRIRSFAANGYVGADVTSDLLSTTFDDPQGLQPVTNISLTEMTVSDFYIQAVVEWTPSPDLPCNYEVLLGKYGGGSFPTPIETQELYKAVLPQMEFRSKYWVGVRAQTMLPDGTVTSESTQTRFNFTTPSCLDYHSGNLTICSPEEAPNVTVVERFNNKNRSLCDVHAFWPETNAVPEYYTVVLDVYNIHKVDGIREATNISGNLTHAVFTIMSKVGDLYFVSVTAVSPGGQIQSEVIHKKNKHCIGFEEDLFEVLWSIPLIFLTTVLLLSGVIVIYNRKNIRKITRRKSIYFQEEFKKPTPPYDKHTQDVFIEPDEYEIKKENIIICNLLGEGAFGIVRKGLLSNGSGPPLEVAIKMLQENPTTEEHRQFQKEIEVMKSVGKHKNIVSLIGCCTQGPRPLLVIEFCALGDLQNYLRQEWKTKSTAFIERHEEMQNNDGIKYAELMPINSKGSYKNIATQNPDCVFNKLYDIQESMKIKSGLTSADLLGFARQVAIGMVHLSNNKVIHRDLAARNVLICSDFTLKISDFGLSRDVYEQSIYQKKESEKLPIKWMALESLMHQVYTTQSDIWSFGILLWEIVTLGGNPYPSTPTNQMFRLLKLGYRMERPPSCCTSLYNIMLSCWKANPKSRPSFSSLVDKLDKLVETYSPNEYLNLELLSKAESGDMCHSNCTLEDF